jgi:hypothetical protein
MPADHARPAPIDIAARLHPEAIARDRAHHRARRCPAKASRGHKPCTCQPDPADLADVWAGRARMARARQAAGLDLNRLDREALRQETT